MSEAARADLAKQVERAQLDLQRSTQDAQAEVQELQQQLQEEFQRRIAPDHRGGGQGARAALHLQRPRLGPGVGRCRPRHHRRRRQEVRRRHQGRGARRAAQAARPIGGRSPSQAAARRDRRPRWPPRAPRVNIAPFLERQRYRFPAVLVDAVSLHDGTRLRASKAVGVGEEFVQGHFPGVPLMPGVLMLEALTQASSALLLSRPDTPPAARVVLRGVDDVKFRRPGGAGRPPEPRRPDRPQPRADRPRARRRRRRRHRRRRSAAGAGDLDRRAAHRCDRLGASRRGHRRRHGRRAARRGRPARGARPAGRGRRLGHRRGRYGGRRRHAHLPVRVGRTAAAGPQVPGRAHPAGDRPRQRHPRVRDDSPRHGRRRWRDARSAIAT